MKGRARGARGVAAVVSSGALLVASGCGTTDDGEVELVIETFGTFGYEELLKEFEEDTGIAVEERVYGEVEDWNDQLTQNLAADDGLGDVVAIEEGILLDVMQTSDSFHDLNEYGAGDMEDSFLDWKWEMGHTPDGKLLGLGTDIGGMGICYRADLYEEAGLSTDREELSSQWETWDDFIEVGKEFEESDVDASFADTTSEFSNAIMRQSGDVMFFNKDDELIIEESEAVERAWDISGQMIENDLTAELEMWSDDWTAAIQEGAFATMPCPAWMLGQIEENAGEDNAGKWDVAEVPGNGGNWGGSWLGVPTQTEHPEEAAQLAQFLTSPEGHQGAWEARNNLPSSPETLESDAVQNHTNEYFSDAPVGEIYAEGALELEPVYFGLNHFPVQQATNAEALLSWEQGNADRDEAWAQAVEEAERIAE
ncbi:cellobiose transport system substrate-binding protein [Lipingzhangella halophila]|uniref:Cellobiose transport system substrate-binding protein n=1 Tax=Lipingzhangella halophila TaxID=1783352 RepID=A0A7W7RM51_9ACTN|nr:extracellular solute-binding protein [Lipingzhangella halophila]MBB4934519.1 cellobiose transport system substrate-binding protein [Lipingzhangella halophila]